MKYVDEFRDPRIAQQLFHKIGQTISQPWTIMEVCGGQTHTLLRSGIDRMIPEQLQVIHGPGCPVCVTPLEKIDQALGIAAQPGVVFCSFGDMLRVPGSTSDLLRVRAEGGDVRTVYSPLDAVGLAQALPDREVVFFAVGFETTAPATALAVQHARRLGLKNFSVLVAHVLVLPAMEAILASQGNRVQGFLAAGHACTVTGFDDYFAMAHRFRVPVVVTGFEPTDLLEGILMLVRQLESGRCDVENQYSRSVQRMGNEAAQVALAEVYEACDQAWRGMDTLPRSGLKLRGGYRAFDATERFNIPASIPLPVLECRSGEVLQGLIRPTECSAFGTRCTPEYPLGAPMVSSEGACAAYWKYHRRGEASSANREGTV